MTQDVLDELIDDVYLVRVDGVVWRNAVRELVQRLKAVLTRLIEQSMYVAAHKTMLFREEIRRYEKNMQWKRCGMARTGCKD